MVILIDQELGKYVVSFRYDEDIVKRLKKIRGAFWSNDDKAWLLPYNKQSEKLLFLLFDEKELFFKIKSEEKNVVMIY